jgi:hypothetical protein
MKDKHEKMVKWNRRFQAGSRQVDREFTNYF